MPDMLGPRGSSKAMFVKQVPTNFPTLSDVEWKKHSTHRVGTPNIQKGLIPCAIDESK